MLAKLFPSPPDNDVIDSIIESSHPALIACLWKDKDYKENLKNLDSIAVFFHKEIHIYYALEDTLDYFRKRFGVSGTPTYLIFHQGRVLETLLGKISNRELIRHVTLILLDHQEYESARDSESNHLDEN